MRSRSAGSSMRFAPSGRAGIIGQEMFIARTEAMSQCRNKPNAAFGYH